MKKPIMHLRKGFGEAEFWPYCSYRKSQWQKFHMTPILQFVTCKNCRKQALRELKERQDARAEKKEQQKLDNWHWSLMQYGIEQEARLDATGMYEMNPKRSAK